MRANGGAETAVSCRFEPAVGGTSEALRQEGKAMRTLSTERLASHLTELYGRIAEGVQNSGVKKRRSLDTKSGVVVQAATAAIEKAHVVIALFTSHTPPSEQ